MRGLTEDTKAEAEVSAREFADSRIEPFWDGDNVVGAVIAAGLDHSGFIAWDTYLGFRAGTTWRTEVPLPAAWVHQMGDAEWANDRHRVSPAQLQDGVVRVMEAAANS